MKDLLYLFNNGHEPFGRGGLGYKPTHKVVLQHPGFVIRGGGRSRTQTAYSTPTQVVYKSPKQIEKEEFTITPDEEEEFTTIPTEEEGYFGFPIDYEEEKKQEPRRMITTTKKAPTISERVKEVKERISKTPLKPIAGIQGRRKTIGSLMKKQKAEQAKIKKENLKTLTKRAEEYRKIMLSYKKIVNEEKEKIMKYRPNLIKRLKNVDTEILNYWKTNSKLKLIIKDYYPKEIIDIIDDIKKKTNVTFKELPAKEFDRQEKFRTDIYDAFGDQEYYFNRARPFMESIIVGGEEKFSKDGEFDIESASEEFFKSGKPAEFSICGPGNKIAKELYGLKNPNFEVTDFVVEDAGSRLGGQFPIDNIDRDNKIFNEMKWYVSVNYRLAYNRAMKLKEMYYNDLLKMLIDEIENYIDYKDLGNTKKTKLTLENIETLKNILIDQDEFNKDYYKNKEYIGIGITMNKFNPVSIPEDYDFEDNPSTKEQIEDVKSNQKQKFIPDIKQRKIRGMKSKSKNEKFDDAFRGIMNREEYDYTITCGFSDTMGVYNYTTDNYVKDDFILGTYKTGFPHDARSAKDYKGVIIPIEKFILPKLKKRSVEI